MYIIFIKYIYYILYIIIILYIIYMRNAFLNQFDLKINLWSINQYKRSSRALHGNQII